MATTDHDTVDGGTINAAGRRWWRRIALHSVMALYLLPGCAFNRAPEGWDRVLKSSRGVFVVLHNERPVGLSTHSFEFTEGTWRSENEFIMRTGGEDRRFYERLDFDEQWPHALCRVEVRRGGPTFEGHLENVDTERRVWVREGSGFRLRDSELQFSLEDYSLEDALAVDWWLLSSPSVGTTLEYDEFDPERFTTDPVHVVVNHRDTERVRYARVQFGNRSQVEVDHAGREQRIVEPLGWSFERLDRFRRLHGTEGAAATDAESLLGNDFGSYGRARSISHTEMGSARGKVDAEPLPLILWEPLPCVGEITPRMARAESTIADDSEPTDANVDTIVHVHLEVAGERVHTWQRRPGLPPRAQRNLAPGAPAVSDARPTVEQRLGMQHPRVVELAAPLRVLPPGEELLRRGVEVVRSELEPRWCPGRHGVGSILETGTGDCTEFSRLFGSLLWSLGHPTREVLGWVRARDGSFVPHMWCEVGIEGEWWSVDPALGQVAADSWHLPLPRHTQAWLGGDALIRIESDVR